MFQTPPDETRDAVRAALDAGYRLIDTAPGHRSAGITFYRDSGHGSTLDDPVIGESARAHGKSPAQVMLRWGCSTGAR